jgi:hypothetical protein
MAVKKKPSRATMATRAKKRAKTSARKLPGKETSYARLELRRAVRHGENRVRRAGVAYVEKAAELEALRIAQRSAERQLAACSAAEAAREQRPFYNFLAQGDSWFSYSCGFAIIHWLQGLYTRENAYFDNVAASGRTLRQMLSTEFKRELSAGPPNGATWDGILLSGGGNDICGDHRFRDWLKPNDGGLQPADSYITNAFVHELGILKEIYEEAIVLVGKMAPGVRLFAHDYDFAIPDGRCVSGRSPHLRADFQICFAGPWMWPAFEERGFHRPGDPVPQLTKDIVTAILKRFAHMLASLEQKHPNQFVLVRTQGTLKPIQDEKLWVNELHPYDDSFKLLAELFYGTLAQTYG